MLNLLDHPVCLSYPSRLAPSAWAEHVPFAMFLVDLLRPKLIVELGTFSGVSYCAFCQAVKELELDARCYAVDTWEGDPQSGFYGPEVLGELRNHHDPLYGDFSELIQSTFDQALTRFSDGSIDLLHIDGFHTYASVKHDFESWLPKMSRQGVLLLHNINIRSGDFGIGKLWEEIKQRYPHFELHHEHGLGLAVVGASVPEHLDRLLNASTTEHVLIRKLFHSLGHRLRVTLDGEHKVKKLQCQVRDQEQVIKSYQYQLSQKGEAITPISTRLNGEKGMANAPRERIVNLQEEEERSALSDTIELLRSALQKREQAEKKLLAELRAKEAELDRSAGSIELLRTALQKKEQATKSFSATLRAKQLELDRITNSPGWRLLKRYGKIKYRYLLPIYRLLGLGPQQNNGPVRRVTGSADAAAWTAAQVMSTQGASPGPGKLDLRRKVDQWRALTIFPSLREEEHGVILDEKPTTSGRHADVICFSIIDWEFRYQRPQQIMSQYAAHGHRVFYISPSRFVPADDASGVQVSEIKENVYEVRLAVGHGFDVYGDGIDDRSLNDLVGSLEALRRRFNINEAISYVMISSWTRAALEAKRLWDWHLIYDCMDEWEDFPGIDPKLVEMERRLVAECDLLVVTAQRLYEKWQGHGRPMVLARNAVDYDFYVENYRPNLLLADAKHPIVGYFGAIADWLDVNLVAHAALQRPDYTFVLIGGVFGVDVSELESLPNVRLLGQQPYELMPQYLYHFDACIIPFKINEITKATDPVKVYEYLSAGKPVVSTELPELEPCREYIYLAHDPADFVAKLDEAILEEGGDRVTRRREFAGRHTWADRYQKISAETTHLAAKASIVVVTYNNYLLNRMCIEGILRNTEYLNYEIVVVDNNSSDGTQSYLRYMEAEHPHIKVILNTANHGFARANNQGIQKSTGDYIVLLNNDTIVPPGWLNRLVNHLRDPQVGLVGPVTNFVGNEAKIDVPYHTWAEMEKFAAEHTWAHDGELADIHMLAMFCIAFGRRTYELIGPLDEQFGIGMFEDDDYSHRVKQNGYRVVCAADVFVHHFGQAAFGKLIQTGQYDGIFEENRRRYESKWGVTWTPHRHARLRFQKASLPPRAVEGSAERIS